jgi:hypothetical protein
VFEADNQVETIKVHVWTSLALVAVPWLATVTWNGQTDKPQLGGREFASALVMRDAQAYLAPAGINVEVGDGRALNLDVDAEVRAADLGEPDKRKQLEIGIIGALRKNDLFQAAMNDDQTKAIHVVLCRPSRRLGTPIRCTCGTRASCKRSVATGLRISPTRSDCLGSRHPRGRGRV